MINSPIAALATGLMASQRLENVPSAEPFRNNFFVSSLLCGNAAAQLVFNMRTADELAKVLKSRAAIEAKLKIAARTGLDDRGTSAPLEVVTVDALRQALVSGLTRVVEVFRMLDRNLDGIVTKKEFRAALPLLGFDGRNTTVVDQLFDELDVDQSGSVDYDELAARLEMRGASAQVREELRATFKTDEQKALESERYGHNPLAAKRTFWAPSGLGA
jgi:hypothetical protein